MIETIINPKQGLDNYRKWDALIMEFTHQNPYNCSEEEWLQLYAASQWIMRKNSGEFNEKKK